MRLEQVIQETKGFSAHDRALLAHCLISGLETQQDEGGDAVWLSFAEQRLDELETGKVQGVSWEEIKGQLKRPS
ncbi:addiction module protein [Halomonas sp. AOP13-D3-9]